MKLLEKNNLVIGGYEPKMSSNGMESQSAILNKLGQLEDIEEELGIDLITLFKALKDGIFIKGDESVIDIRDDRLYLSYIPEKWFVEHYFLGTFSFEDYGKTWALTKEELEK